MAEENEIKTNDQAEISEETLQQNAEEKQEQVIENKESTKEISEQDFMDKIIAKRNKKKRIVFSTLMALTLALAIVLTVLACVPVNVEPFFISEAKSSTYEIHYNSNTRGLDTSDQRFAKLDKEYHKAFSMSYLTALFLGENSSYTLNEDTKMASSYILNYVGTDYIKIRLDQRYEVKNPNKTLYRSVGNSSTEKLTFDTVYVSLQTTNEFKEVVIALPVYGAYVNSNKVVDENIATIIYVKLKANLYNLTQCIVDLFELED